MHNAYFMLSPTQFTVIIMQNAKNYTSKEFNAELLKT